jgi:hypothetical protein
MEGGGSKDLRCMRARKSIGRQTQNVLVFVHEACRPMEYLID